ncbi:MAG: hypothetical protein WBL21_05170, partial [Salinimicrobium sp.]
MRMLRLKHTNNSTAVSTWLFFGLGSTKGLLLLVFLFSFEYSFGQNGVTITSTVTSPTQQNPIPIKFVFDQPINGVDLGDVAENGGVLSDFSIRTPDFTYTGLSTRLSSFELNALNPDLSKASNAI